MEVIVKCNKEGLKNGQREGGGGVGRSEDEDR